MPTSLARLALFVSATLAAGAALGCSGAHGALPPGAHVETLQTQRLVLHGTAPANPASVTCANRSGSSTPQYLELKEDATANVVLRPIAGVAVLHVQELASNKTWCVMSKGDGTGALISGEFPIGVYAISVEGSHASDPLPYAVAFERL
jgi:hypothetical protein